MSKTKDTAELRRIKKWYDRIMQGPRPTKAELAIQFRGYTDQAELLIQRIEDGQPWEDFILGIDGAPCGLLRCLSKNSERFCPQGNTGFDDPRQKVPAE
jgi:hypothetical protein